eukprot:TRINITY_DN2717_c0_g3_i15.p1 TRINITY_DN2717_c0_g3~~TRINITY_DN2717_c0_g3_i15.p1  ORF type:complete len:208 (+),score=26.06 TRINITY_DN2717_c0_g3_i15:80-703(+)
MLDVIFYLGSWLGGTLSFVLLVFASWCVGEGGEILGQKYDASMVGGLLIAWLNTAPETIFFLTALQSNNPRFAVGAVSGSTIVVSTVAMGVCYYFGTLSRKDGTFIIQKSVRSLVLVLLVSVVVPFSIALLGFKFYFAVIGVFLYVSFVLWELTKSRKKPEKKDPELGTMFFFSGETKKTNVPEVPFRTRTKAATRKLGRPGREWDT